MIGTLRFFLANMVVLNHLFHPTSGKLGAQAVVAFYLISGFLMTRVLHDTYGFSRRGIWHFLINRTLRIYPLYWLFAGLTAIMLLVAPATGKVNPAMILPSNLYDVFRTVTLWDYVWAESRLVPPAWSLSVEFAFYILMPLLLSRSRMTATIWFAVSVAIHIALLAVGVRFGLRYYPSYAASLFFSAGAMVYFYWDWLRRIEINRPMLATLLGLACVFPIVVEAIGLDKSTIGYYGSIVLFVPVIITLLQIRDPRWEKRDRWLGDMAYPIFISHFFAAGVVATVLPSLGATPRFLLAWPLTIAASALSLIVVQQRVDKIRSWLRPKHPDNRLPRTAPAE